MEKCNALPNLQTLQALDAQQVTLMHAQRTTAIGESKRDMSFPQMDIPKLTATNYEEFYTSFKAVTSRTIGHNDIPLDYLLHEQKGQYSHAWATRMEKLKNCVVFTGPAFNDDNEALS